MNIAVCVPSHNEPNIHQVIAQIQEVIGRSNEISVFNDTDSKGKGYALREALKRVKADYYIFIDGDNDVDPKQIEKIMFFLKRYDVVVGKKQLPVRWDRKILTFASRIWIRLLFGLKCDTQTGLKGFNYRPQWELDRWGFDFEILYKAKKMGKTIKEVPVYATVSSTKSFNDIWSTFVDSIKVRWGHYGQTKRSE